MELKYFKIIWERILSNMKSIYCNKPVLKCFKCLLPNVFVVFFRLVFFNLDLCYGMQLINTYTA